jgi:hypothetical protein
MSQAVFSAARPSTTAPQLFAPRSRTQRESRQPKFPYFTRFVHSNADPTSVSSINWMMSPSTHGGTMQGRPLTYDEQKAADAAFAGQPFNSDWSNDAKAVYDGIVHAMSACAVDSELEPAGR